MKKMEAVIQPSRMEAVKQALSDVGVQGMTLSEVRGHGRQKGHSEVYRGNEYTVDLLPKVKLEVVLPDELVDNAVEAVIQAARTGKIGDGKVFISEVTEAVRIRDNQRGNSAL
jgi:nitrogen regulatory protein PII